MSLHRWARRWMWRLAGLTTVLALLAGWLDHRAITARSTTPGAVTVASVYDGDTVTLSDGRKVRYNAVDTPEFRSASGRASAECVNPDAAQVAKERNQALVLGQQLTLEDTGRRSYERIVGDLILPDGTNVSEVLIAEGLGVRYDRHATNACPAGVVSK